MVIVVLYILLLDLVSSRTPSFNDKTNKDLHCKLTDKDRLTELLILPQKHVYSDANGKI